MTEAGGAGAVGPKARLILQQCLTARLQIQPATTECEAEFVEIGRGLIIYLCFLKGATSDIVEKLVKAALTARLSEAEEGGRVSVLDLPGDILVIPQATLGGSLKGKVMQYHGNVEKQLGKELYQRFLELCQESVTKSTKCQEANTQVRWGTYGNRQVFSCTTNGPYTHLIEM